MNMGIDFRRELIHSRIVDGISELENSEVDMLSFVENEVDQCFPLVSSEERHELSLDVLNQVSGYGILESLLKDPLVNEIMINARDRAFIDRSGSIEEVDFETTDVELTRLLQKIAGACGARCDVSSPILDAWLEDGSRVHGVLPPVAANGPYLTIRRFISKSFDLGSFCGETVMKSDVAELIHSSKNVVVAGGTSSGKTTLLNTLMHLVPENERVISIEETAELRTDHPHWVRLLSRAANGEGAGQVTLGELVKASLRMRPDRIIVGEVRSSEAFDLIQALNTGHDGSLCTIHANGPFEVIGRMASLAMFAHPGMNYEAIVSQICYGIDAIIYVTRNKNGNRQIVSLSRVVRDASHVAIVNETTGEVKNV